MVARVRLILAWALFGAWVAWLAWQSYRYGRFPVVSHAQMANADVAVVADLTGHGNQPDKQVKVTRVIWGSGGNLAGQELVIANMPEYEGFQPGAFVLPLVHADGGYAIAGFARSPLIKPALHPILPIYPATPVVLEQVAALPAKR